jgi:hypothetical protein
MPDTGAPWNIPYVENADLVSDWPADSLLVANAVAAGLSAAALPGIGSNVVSTASTSSFSTSSSTLVDVTDVNVSITPSSASSKVLVMALVHGQTGSSSSDWREISMGVTRSGTLIYEAVQQEALTIAKMAIHFHFLDSPSSASAVTYQLQTLSVGNATTLQGAIITAIEVAV